MIGESRRSVKELVAAANEEIKTYSQDEALAMLGQDDVVFIDIRDIRELKRDGMLEGAMHTPRGMVEFGLIQIAHITKKFSKKTKPSCFTAPALGVRLLQRRPRKKLVSHNVAILRVALWAGKNLASRLWKKTDCHLALRH